MSEYRVQFHGDALAQLESLYDYIADMGTPGVAARYIDAIVGFCEGLAQFPHRGTLWEDIRAGLRTVSYQKRTLIAFTIRDDAVTVLGIFYGGRDYEALLDVGAPV